MIGLADPGAPTVGYLTLVTPEGFRFLIRWGLGLYSTLALIVGPLGTQVPGPVGVVTVDSDPTNRFVGVGGVICP